MSEAKPALIDVLGASAHFIGALDEFSVIAEALTRAREEISALAPHDIHARRLKAASEQLGAVIAETERATLAIIAAAEAILALDCADEVKAQGVKILEACAFHDITGQRVTRALAAVSVVDQRVAGFAAAMGLAARGACEPAGLLNGPGLDGPETDQEGVDALLAGLTRARAA